MPHSIDDKCYREDCWWWDNQQPCNCLLTATKSVDPQTCEDHRRNANYLCGCGFFHGPGERCGPW